MLSPHSPVRTRAASKTGITNILPSPGLPVRFTSIIVFTTFFTRLSGTITVNERLATKRGSPPRFFISLPGSVHNPEIHIPFAPAVYAASGGKRGNAGLSQRFFGCIHHVDSDYCHYFFHNYIPFCAGICAALSGNL
jgi:hypothetical protein